MKMPKIEEGPQLKIFNPYWAIILSILVGLGSVEHDGITAVKNVDLKGKFVAFFGLGDQVLYPDHFVDALGIFKEEMEQTDATIIGEWPIEGYRFTDSDGYDNNMFFGLALDEDRQAELSLERAQKWTTGLKKQAGF